MLHGFVHVYKHTENLNVKLPLSVPLAEQWANCSGSRLPFHELIMWVLIILSMDLSASEVMVMSLQSLGEDGSLVKFPTWWDDVLIQRLIQQLNWTLSSVYLLSYRFQEAKSLFLSLCTGFNDLLMFSKVAAGVQLYPDWINNSSYITCSGVALRRLVIALWKTGCPSVFGSKGCQCRPRAHLVLFSLSQHKTLHYLQSLFSRETFNFLH